jgi:hypothetical protein
VVAGAALDQRPAQQPRALLADLPSMGFEIGLAVLGGEPRPTAQRVGAREALDVADLGPGDGGDAASQPGDRLDRLIAAVVAEMSVDVTLERPHLAVIDRDQPRSDSTRRV